MYYSSIYTTTMLMSRLFASNNEPRYAYNLYDYCHSNFLANKKVFPYFFSLGPVFRPFGDQYTDWSQNDLEHFEVKATLYMFY